MKKPLIIGIAGGTASGKTTLAIKIQDEFKDRCTILSHDFYYKSHDKITLEERLTRNYDCPEAYETELLISQTKELKNGKDIERPTYSYSSRLREPYTVNVKSTDLIVIEGMLVLEKKELLDLMDMKIFVDTDADIRLARLIKRDTTERDIDIEYIISKYLTTLKPMHEKYIEPTKKYADTIISGESDDNIDKIIREIQELSNK